MADVTFEGQSDFDKVKRDFDALHREMVKLREENKRAKDMAKQAAQEQAAENRSLTKTLSDQVSGLFSVQSAVGFVTAAYAKLREEQAKLAADSSKVQKTLLQSVSAMGDLQNLPEIETWLKASQGVSLEQATQAYSGVSGAMPGSPLKLRQGLAQATHGAAVLFPDAMQQLGKQVGEFAGFDEQQAASRPDLVVSKVLAARHLAGDNADQLGGDDFVRSINLLKKSGMSEARAIGMATAGLENEVNPATLGLMAGKVMDRSRELIRPSGRALTAEEKLKNQFTSANDAERWRMLTSEQAVQEAELGIRNVGKAGLIDLATVDKKEAYYAHAGRQDILPGQVSALDRSEAGSEARSEQGLKADTNTVARQTAETEARAWDRIEEVKRQILHENKVGAVGKLISSWGDPIDRAVYGTPAAFAEATGNSRYIEAASPAADNDLMPLTPDQEKMIRAIERSNQTQEQIRDAIERVFSGQPAVVETRGGE